MITNETTTPQELAQVQYDGGTGPVKPETLEAWKAEAQYLAKSCAHNINTRRSLAQETLHCQWDGQSDDGRKHADAMDGEPAFPFEGAADTRVRLADMIVNERVLVLMAAALRGTPRVKGLDLRSEALGQRLSVLLRWVIKNKLGGQYMRELMRVARYQEGDCPGCAALGVYWQQEPALEMRSVTLPEVAQALTEAGATPEELAELEVQLLNPDRDEASAELLQGLLPHLSARRARTMVRELRENEVADYPAPYLRKDEPALKAYRLFENIYLPTNAGEADELPYYFVRELLTVTQLKERAISHGYEPSFIEDLLEHEGETVFEEYTWSTLDGYSQDVTEEDQVLRRGRFEVMTVFFKAVNQDNVPGIYTFSFSGLVETAATDRQLVDYKHGRYPLALFAREILGERYLDSRGVPEVVSTDQYALKLLTDSFSDNVTMSTLPNILAPKRRGRMQLQIGPLKVIRQDRPGEVGWMEPPKYPQGNDVFQDQLWQRINEYWGRFGEKVPPVLTQLHQAGSVALFLNSLADALGQLLQLCQQYLDDEELQMITGDDGQAIGQTRADIQGKFQVELSFDPRDLNMEYLKEQVGLIVQILQIDTLSTIERAALVQVLFTSLNPVLADATLRPVQEADRQEVDDERKNFTEIAAGLEPPMAEDGQNFGLRLQVLEEIEQINPEAVAKLSPKSREIYDARKEHLANQVQQNENAQIGRQVGQPVLGQ